MYSHFSRRTARGELCDGVTHFPFLSLFFFFPECIPLTGNKYQDQTLPGKRLQEAALVPAAGCSGTAGAPAPGETRRELLPPHGQVPLRGGCAAPRLQGGTRLSGTCGRWRQRCKVLAASRLRRQALR